jgi:hypothetical protein
VEVEDEDQENKEEMMMMIHPRVMETMEDEWYIQRKNILHNQHHLIKMKITKQMMSLLEPLKDLVLRNLPPVELTLNKELVIGSCL